MHIEEVLDKKTRKKFLDVPRILYKNNPYWVCPLDSAIEKVFDPKRNVFFEHGNATRWILIDDNKKLIGRVAAFINEKKAYNYKQPTGGMGFFECINDKKAAFMLFDKCKEWLQERGMEAMDGPINFGENDNFWGMLVEGFDMPPMHGMNYNFKYYKDLFEAYGFKPYFAQNTNHLDLTVPFPERFWRIAERIGEQPGYSFRHFEYSQAEKFVNDLKQVYDEAWIHHENFTPINKKDIWVSLKQAKPILIEEFIWFAYHYERPIAFLVMFPDVNELIKHFNGKMNLINKIHFLILKKRKVHTQTRITIMGVTPDFQKKGVESGIFWYMDKVMRKWPKIKTVEMSWVGDFNPKMQAIHKAVGGKLVKKHVTFRKQFTKEDTQTYYRKIPIG